jgi:hypothetical protein
MNVKLYPILSISNINYPKITHIELVSIRAISRMNVMHSKHCAICVNNIVGVGVSELQTMLFICIAVFF